MPDSYDAGMNTKKSSLRVAVIGAGFSGIGAAIRLRSIGVEHITIFEKASDVGGTWRDNTYPGAACDVQSHLYSLSFELNPRWTRRFPAQPEIQAYLKAVFAKHNLVRITRFDTEITELRYDEQTYSWSVSCNGVEPESFDVIVNSSGVLSRPAMPTIEGLDQFNGISFHSARWRHDVELSGKNIAVIGTGASAIQFVPEIAQLAASVTVFQRTAPWVVPRDDAPFTQGQQRRFARFPWWARLNRWGIYLRNEMLALAFVGPNAAKGTSKISRQISDGGKQFIAACISDPVLRAKVTPTFAPGCKRLLISNDYYPALTRPNVDVVTTPIERAAAHALVTSDGQEHPADVIVFGTGFKATEFIVPMKIFGVGGVELSDEWSRGARTHLGISVSGFPNMYTLLGPNTALGHNSVVFMVECQLHFIMGAVKHMMRSGARSLDLQSDVEQASYSAVQGRMHKTVWLSGCQSWYRSPDGRIDTLWPGSTISYWWRTRFFKPKNFNAER